MAEELPKWEGFSSDMMSKFRDYRKHKNKEGRARAAQIVGGAAETMRTGESAASTFAKREPYWKKGLMSRQEKVTAKRPLLKDIERVRQFDYTQEMRKETEILRAKLRREEAISRDELAAKRLNLSASQHRARNQMTVLGDDIGRNLKEQEELSTLSPMGQERIKETRSANQYLKDYSEASANTRIQNIKDLRLDVKNGVTGADVALKKEEDNNKTDTGKAYPSKGDLIDYFKGETHIQDQAKKAAALEAKKVAKEFAEDYSVSDADVGIKLLANRAGVTTDDLVAGEQYYRSEEKRTVRYDDLQEENQKVLTDLDKEYEALDTKRHSAARAVGPGAPQAALRPLDESDFAGIASAGEQAIAEPLEDLGGEAGEEGEAEEEDMDPNGFMGIKGKKRPLGAANRFEEALKTIENMPEYRPSVMLKQKIMESTEFKAYMAKFHFTDPDLAFNEFKRDWRKKRKENRNAFYEKRLKKRGDEMEALKPKTVKLPVHGSTSPGEKKKTEEQELKEKLRLKEEENFKKFEKETKFGDVPIVVDEEPK